jgi:GGDEF domain-containing protein
MSNTLSTEQLQDLVQQLSWNDGFGCYTRAGFEKLIWPSIADRARWILYFDVDGVHELNEQSGGYEVFDAMMKAVFANIRGSDYVAGQFKSGDEFMVCLTENYHHNPLNPGGMKDRLVEELNRHGLKATFAMVEVTSMDLLENIKPAIDAVHAAKKSRSAAGRRTS